MNEQAAKENRGRDTERNAAGDHKADQGVRMVDKAGSPIPSAAQTYWRRRKEAKELVAEIAKAKARISALNKGDPMWCEVNLNGVLADLYSAMSRMKSAVPEYVCTMCYGYAIVKGLPCYQCKGRGVVSNFMWKVMPK